MLLMLRKFRKSVYEMDKKLSVEAKIVLLYHKPVYAIHSVIVNQTSNYALTSGKLYRCC